MNYYVLGILAGATLSVGLFFLIRALCKKAGDCEYDERQMAGRGKAFRAGFFTMLAAGSVSACLDLCGLLPGSAFPWSMGALLLGVAVFAVTAIHYDAYIGFKSNPRRYYIMGACFIAAMVCNGILNIRNADPDKIAFGILNFQVAAIWVVIVIALLARQARGKEEE